VAGALLPGQIERNFDTTMKHVMARSKLYFENEEESQEQDSPLSSLGQTKQSTTTSQIESSSKK
jgi:hypothetical protein